jgi:hypothetical protein
MESQGAIRNMELELGGWENGWVVGRAIKEWGQELERTSRG